MPKNIVVFSDGTGQEGGKGNNTNVYIFQAISGNVMNLYLKTTRRAITSTFLVLAGVLQL